MCASSRGVTARSAKPTTARRSAPWPTSGAMLMALPARPQRRQILAERAPVPGDAVQPPGVVRPVLDGVGAVLLGERSRRHAAVAGDVRGDALAHGRLGARVQQDREIRVRVRVDEAGGDVAAAGVDDAPAAQRPRRADGGDAVAAHGDVPGVPGVAAPVDDAAAGDDEVVDASRAVHREDLVRVLARRPGAGVEAPLVQVADHAADGHALVAPAPGRVRVPADALVRQTARACAARGRRAPPGPPPRRRRPAAAARRWRAGRATPRSR